MKIAVAVAAVTIIGAVAVFAYGVRSLSAARNMPDRAFTIMPQPDQPLRIVILGTSLTASYSWPGQLEDALGACLARGAVVTVHARGGATSRFGLAAVPEAITDAPDAVLVEFVTNDADIRSRISLAESRRLHSELVTGLRQTLPNAAIGLMIMNPAHGLRRLARPLLFSYDLAYGDLADRFSLGLVNLLPDWTDIANAPDNWRDGVHPTDAAASAVMVPRLERAILGGLGLEHCDR